MTVCIDDARTCHPAPTGGAAAQPFDDSRGLAALACGLCATDGARRAARTGRRL